MSAKTDKCSDNNKRVCDYNDFSRLRFFHGMLLDDKDFRAEQQYHANKRRFLNRMLHGSGVVCGLELHGEVEKRNLTVTRGFALDCSGNEIWVPQDVPIDICSLLPAKKTKAEECKPREGDKPTTYYIGVRYQEKETNPVSVYLPSGNCEERTCENSRIKEGYCIEIVDCCAHDTTKENGVLKGLCECGKGQKPPDSKQICRDCGALKKAEPGKEASPAQLLEWCNCVVLENFCEQSPRCPDCCCCDDPCFVVLGRIEVDADCKLVSACNNECRKYVLTPHLLRHLLVGVFGGFEDYFFVQLPDGTRQKPPTATELADNPVSALCWALKYLVAQEGKPGIQNCDKPRRDPQQDPAKRFVTLADFQTLTKDFAKTQDVDILKTQIGQIQTLPLNKAPVVNAQGQAADVKSQPADAKSEAKDEKTADAKSQATDEKTEAAEDPKKKK